MSGSRQGEATESSPAAKARNMLMPPISIMPISDMFYDLVSMIDCPAEPPQPKSDLSLSKGSLTPSEACAKLRSIFGTTVAIDEGER